MHCSTCCLKNAAIITSKGQPFFSFPPSSLTDQRGTLLKTAEMQSMDFPVLWFSSGMSLQAQATPEVLGLNVPFTASMNNTLFVCVCGYTSSLQCGAHFNVHSQGLFVVLVLRKEKCLCLCYSKCCLLVMLFYNDVLLVAIVVLKAFMMQLQSPRQMCLSRTIKCILS